MLRTFKRKDGKSPYYYITGTVRFGRKVKTINAESTGCTNKVDAEFVCTKRIQEITNELKPEKEMTYQECSQKLLNDPIERPSSKRESIYLRVEKYVGSIYLNDFTNDIVRTKAKEMYPVIKQFTKRFMDYPLEERIEISSKYNTVNNCFIMPISKVLHYGAENKWCGYMKLKSFPQVSSRDKPKEKFTIKEINACLDNSDDFQIKLLLVFCFYTACRVQEALEVHWDRKGHYNRPMIDLEHRKITLWENKTQRWRTTFMHDKLYNYLSKINDREGYLFEWRSLLDKQKTDQSIKTRWEKMLSNAGVSLNKKRHACRHTHASILGDNGASVEKIMKAVGWTSEKTALNYINSSSDDIEDMISGLPQ